MPTIDEIRQQYPDYSDLSDGQLADALHRKFYNDVPRAEFDAKIGLSTAADTAADFAKSGGIGLVKGAMGLATAPRGMVDLAIHGGTWLADKALPASVSRDTIKNVGEGISQAAGKLPMIGPRYSDVAGTLESATGPLYEPKTVPGQYAQTVGEFLPGAAVGGGGMLGNALRYGVAPALVSEAAGQATKGSPAEPWVRAGSALATGGAAAMLARPRNAEAALGPAMEGVDRATLDAAQGLMVEAAGRGINLTWAQAIERAGSGHAPLQRLQRFVERTPEGQPAMAAFYEGQPQAMRAASEAEFNNISPPAANPYTVGPNAAEAATGALNDVRQQINQGTEHLYRGSAHHLIANANTGSPASQSVRNQWMNDDILRNSVPGVTAPIENFPPHSVASINMTGQRGREIAENLRTNEGGNNRYKASLIDQQIDTAERAARAQSTDYDLAKRLQAQLRADTLNPLEQGPLGRVANAGTTEQATQALFGPKLAGGEREVGRAIVDMEGRQPGVGSALVRQYLGDQYNAGSSNLVGGQNYYGGAKFAKNTFGNQQGAADIGAAVRGAAGAPAADAGLNRLVEALRATGRRLPEGSQTATDLGMADAVTAMRNPVESALSVAGKPAQAVGLMADRYGEWRARDTARELARLLQDPNEIELLARIAGQSGGGSNSAAILANALMASQTSPHSGR